jgi:hypothetical protein
VKPSLVVVIPSLILTTAVWFYFQAAGYPLNGPALVVVLALCFGIVMLSGAIWRRAHSRKGKDVAGNS